MLCLKKRRTYSFTQGACAEAPRHHHHHHRHRSASSSKRDAPEQRYNEALNGAVATLPRKLTPREERSSAMVLTVTEDTPADMLAGSMELLVQMPRDHHVQTQRVTVQRSTPMMDLLVQIATAHKLTASSYTLQAIGERGLVLPHQPNTPIGALDALQVKLLPKQGTFLSRKSRQTNQPFETTFRLQVHLPRNQLYVSRVSPKTNLGEILDEVCREKNLDRNKYELRHPANLAETLDLMLSLQDYHLQEVTLCPRQQNRSLTSALSSQDIMALQKQEECRRQQTKQSVFGFMFKKSKESSLSTDSLGNRSISPARSDETARSNSPVPKAQAQQQQPPPPPPARPLRKRRPAPKPPTQQQQQNSNLQTQTTTITQTVSKNTNENGGTTTTADKDKIVISHSRNSSDSSGYHEASVLSDNPDNSAGRMPETLPRRGRMQGILESPRKLAHTSQASKSLGNLAMSSSHGGTLSRGISNTSLSSAGQRKKRAAPPPPMARPLPSAISAQGLERIVDSDESLTSDMDLSKPSSDIDVGAAATGSNSKASSDIACHVRPIAEQPESVVALDSVEHARVVKKEQAAPPVPRPRKAPRPPQPSTSVESPVASRASLVRSSSPTPSGADSVSFGLPSLTEDEREAIDSIVKATTEFESLKSETSGEVERRDSEFEDVFVEAPLCSADVSLIIKDEDANEGGGGQAEIISVPEAFKDDIVELEHPAVKKTEEVREVEKRPVTAAVEKMDSELVKEEHKSADDELKDVKSEEQISETKDKHATTAAAVVEKTNTVQVKEELVSAVGDLTVVKSEEQISETKHTLAATAVVEKTNTVLVKEEHENAIDDLKVVKSEKPISETRDEHEQFETPEESKIIVKAEPEDIKEELQTPTNSSLDVIKVEDISLPETAATSTPIQPAKEVKFQLSDESADNTPVCAVISTIPKCDHLTDYGVADQPPQNPEPHSSPKRRGKIVRSQSEMSHFEVGPAERHAARHLTSNGEAFTFALNPNLCGAATRSIEAAAAAAGKAPTDTDILLQKVSDTLSHSLTPPSPPPTPEDQAPPSFARATEPPQGFGSASEEVVKPASGVDQSSAASLCSKGTNILESKKLAEDDQQQQQQQPSSASNLTLGSQQDTSDYVSASGEDLSIGDWEYQIPAPPSAFRDDEPPSSFELKQKEKVTDTIIKESISIEAEIHHRVTKTPPKSSTLPIQPQKPSTLKYSIEEPVHQSSKVTSSVDAVDFCQSKPQKPATPQLTPDAAELKKAEIISELETKISSQKPIVEPAVPRHESDAPKIAPVENNLSNFTITTYTRQKSMDIFEQIDQQQQYSDNNRVINTFATLTRGRSMASDYADEKRNGMLKSAQSMERVSAPLVDERAKFVIERTEIYREKPVHRSKSYITLSSNEKFQNRAIEHDKNKDERKVNERLDFESNEPSRKFTSLANVNASTNDEIPSNKEKFSQWRENILRKQEEPTKEKQLQSLQVLKSILPQLKNAQATEENGYRSSSDNFTTIKRQESQYDQPARDTSPVSSSITSDVYLRTNRRTHEPAKRYTYGGPPSVSFGSWSERPSVNVQIKTDTDYKFGGSNSNSASGARTVVNLNSGASEANEKMQNGNIVSERKESLREIERDDEPRVDTTSVSFRELTKTFGKTDAPVRPKPPVALRTQRHFEFLERSKPEVAPKQNGFADSHKTTTTFGLNHNRTSNGPPPPVKRYTSVVGITNNNNVSNNINNNNGTSQTNFRFVNGQSKAPTVKGFVNGQKDFVVPKPPTMPIITGVTLKSVNARPKSSPPSTQADPRDQLLESIRNFGGRGRLRSVNAEKY